MHNIPTQALPVLMFFASVVGVNTARADTFYVDGNTGSDTNACTEAAPCATIGAGISALSPGDTLIVRDGLYFGTQNFIADIPDGSERARTAVRAEHPYGVRIQNDGSLEYRDFLSSQTGQWTDVDGFIFDQIDSVYPPFSVAIGGDHNRLFRSIVRRQGVQDEYGGWVSLQGEYNLVEDVAGVGNARYGFSSGGTTSTSAYNIFRRVVGRFDYTASNQPKSTFNHYGANSGFTTHHHVFQNCISVDGNDVARHSNNGFKGGGIRAIKTAADDVFVGNIILNEQLEHAGMRLDGRNHIVRDNVIWGLSLGDYGGGSVPAGVRSRPSSTFVVSEHYSVGEVAGEPISGPPSPGSHVGGSLMHIVRPNFGETDGATVMQRVGVSGALYGDPGWDEVTSEPLWPFPNEEHIKAVFSEPNAPTGEQTPRENDTLRGFCANTDAYGQPMTLTRYIWQVAGNPIPTEIYDAALPDAGGPSTDGGLGFDVGPNVDGGLGFDAGRRDGGEPPMDGSGCSCSTSRGPPSVAWLFALAGLFLRRRES